MTNTTTPQNGTSINSLQARAKSRFEARKKLAKKMVTANAALQDSDGYAVVGPVTVDAYLIYSTLNVVLTFTDGSGTVTFDGDSWGTGAGDFQGIGAGYMAYDPSQLTSMGSVSYSVQFGAVEGGGVQIEWWNGDTFVGEFTAGGVGDGVGLFFGTGTFKNS